MRLMMGVAEGAVRDRPGGAPCHSGRQRPMLGSGSGKRPAGLITPVVIGADVFLIQMASIVKVSALGHSKHRIQRS